jgi:hypothetical protein
MGDVMIKDRSGFNEVRWNFPLGPSQIRSTPPRQLEPLQCCRKKNRLDHLKCLGLGRIFNDF